MTPPQEVFDRARQLVDAAAPTHPTVHGDNGVSVMRAGGTDLRRIAAPPVDSPAWLRRVGQPIFFHGLAPKKTLSPASGEMTPVNVSSPFRSAQRALKNRCR